MRPFVLCVPVALLLGMALKLCVVHAAPAPAPKDPKQAAQEAIQRLALRLDCEDVTELARKIVAEHDSGDISSVFETKRRGGMGVGKLAPPGQVDSVDKLIRDLARKGPSADELGKYHDDLLRIARVTQAMAELAPFRASEGVRKSPARAAEWQKVSADFKVKTREFREAVEAKDAARVKKAANTLNHTCCDCHGLND